MGGLIKESSSLALSIQVSMLKRLPTLPAMILWALALKIH
jgi:hypothetical protein